MMIYIMGRCMARGITQEDQVVQMRVDRSTVTQWEIEAWTPTTDRLP